MIIASATLHNFGPYFGEQTIELGPGERPLTLVHGENMRGKTSLLNAIRWALYGHVRTRTGAGMPAVRLLNSKALQEGSYFFSVEMTVKDGSDTYVITRQARALSTPRKDSDFEIDVHLRKNETFLSADEGELEIGRLLPKDVAHFFLFDGEMLNDFEELLADPTQQSQAIKRSIEQILGVPAVENAINDLTALHREASKRLTQAAKTVQAAEKDAERSEELAADIAVAESDVGDIQDQIEAARNELTGVDDELRRFDLVKGQADTLERLRHELTLAKNEASELDEARRRILGSAWLDMLTLALQPRLESLERERDDLMLRQKIISESNARRTALEILSSGDECPVCGSRPGRPGVDKLREELASMPIPDDPEVDRLEAVVGSIATLRRIRPANIGPQVEAVERDQRRVSVRRTEHRNRITELETALRDHPLDRIGQLQRQRDKTLRALGGLEDAARTATDQLELLRVQASAVQNRIAQVSDPQLDTLNREVELYESLLRVMKNALDDLLERLKTVIERDASAVFLDLTTDKSYQGLRINDYYGLYIIGATGDDVPVRSAGAEQVVALSLIAALNRNAVKRGPVIMDTPFGRLDVKHRANILSYLSTMADQVVLLVHSGEVDRDRDLAIIAPHVQREYELRAVSSVHTEIAPMMGVRAARS